MSTVTVNLPDEVDDDLDRFVENHPEYEDREDLLVDFTRFMLEAEESIEDVRHATGASGAGDEEQALGSNEQAVEASRAALESLLDFFGVPRRVSDETLERIERSREQFDRGDYVALEDV